MRGDVVCQINNTEIADSSVFVNEVTGSRGTLPSMHLVRNGRLHQMTVRAVLDTRGLPSGYIISVAGQNSSQGVVLTRVYDGGSAAAAGLRVGDIIVSVNGTRTNTMTALREIVNTGKPLTFEVLREGRALQMTVSPTFNR